MALTVGLSVGAGSARAAFGATATATTTASTASLLAPTALLATGGGSVSLSWTATASTWATGTRLFRATAAGGPYTQIAEIAGTATTTYSDNPGSGTYHYVAQAYYTANGANWTSPNSNEVSATMPSTAPTFVKEIGSATCSVTSFTVPVPLGGVAIGNTVLVRLMLQGNVAGAVSVTDTKANTYTTDQDVTDVDQRIALFSAHVTSALSVGDSITVNHPDANVDAVVIEEFSGLAATGSVDAIGSGSGNSTTPSASLTTTQTNDLVYGAVSMANTPTVNQPGDWQPLTTVNAQTPCGSASTFAAYRVGATAGAYSYGPTTSSADRWAAAIVAYKAVS